MHKIKIYRLTKSTVRIFIWTNEWYNFSTINNSLWVLFLLLCLLWYILGVLNLPSVLPCAVINHFFSGGFSHNSILFILYRIHFPSENNAWQGFSQDGAHGVGDRGQSFSRGCRADKGNRWWDWHPLHVYTIQKYLQGNMNSFFFWIPLYPHFKAFLAAIFYNVLFLCCQNMCFMLLLAVLESLQ